MPPKTVPCALVSRGIIVSRIAASLAVSSIAFIFQRKVVRLQRRKELKQLAFYISSRLCGLCIFSVKDSFSSNYRQHPATRSSAHQKNARSSRILQLRRAESDRSTIANFPPRKIRLDRRE